MRFVIGLLALVFLFLAVNVVSAAEYYVDILEGVGLGDGSGDHSNNNNNSGSENETIEDENDTEDDDDSHFKRKIKESLKIKTYIPNLIEEDGIRNIKQSIKANEFVTVSDTVKIPINWTPIIVWIFIIIGVGSLIGGGYYIYSIYWGGGYV